jgi:hypothetical protein
MLLKRCCVDCHRNVYMSIVMTVFLSSKHTTYICILSVLYNTNFQQLLYTFYQYLTTVFTINVSRVFCVHMIIQLIWITRLALHTFIRYIITISWTLTCHSVLILPVVYVVRRCILNKKQKYWYLTNINLLYLL